MSSDMKTLDSSDPNATAERPLRTASPHDILQAWQDGRIGYRQTMKLTGSENLFELYQACRSSGVPIRSDLTDADLRVVDAAVADILAE